MIEYSELCASTHYSFLHGGSSPADMVLRAMELGMAGIGIALLAMMIDRVVQKANKVRH